MLGHFFSKEILPTGYEFDSHAWPLHITIIPNFYATNFDALLPKITAAVSNFDSFNIVVGDEAHFGPHNNVLVNEIMPNDNLHKLHSTIITLLEDGGVEFYKPNFIKDNYKPHITAQPSERVYEGDILNIHGLAVVQLEPNGIPHERVIVRNDIFLKNK